VLVTESPDGVEAVEERFAALLSLLLNLPSITGACAALLVFGGHLREPAATLARILGWAIVLAPFLTSGAVAHAIWAGRVGRVGKRSLLAIRITTAVGILALLIVAWVTLQAFAV
jgi:hypothetical protein